MAIAGKVAITPGGEWSVDVAYDKLVVVTFGNNVYLSIKPSTGIEPTNEEYWMLLIENVTQEQYDNIINGTTPVGNANKLGGKGASEYALSKFHGVASEWASFMNSISQVTNGRQYRVQLDEGKLILYIIDGDNVTGVKEFSTTADLANFDADTVDGFHAWQLQNVNAVKEPIGNYLYSQYEDTDNTFHIKNTDTSIRTKVDTCADLKDYLPKSGGTISGSLKFKTVDNGYTEMTKAHGSDFDNGTAIYDYDSSGSYVALVLQRKNGLLRYYDDHGGKDILHTGNKPSGTYTGNGSDSERYVYVGNGLGGIIAVVSVNGLALITDYVTLYVTPTGVTSNNYAYLRGDQVIFYTSNSVLNASGVTYTYFRL